MLIVLRLIICLINKVPSIKMDESKFELFTIDIWGNAKFLLLDAKKRKTRTNGKKIYFQFLSNSNLCQNNWVPSISSESNNLHYDDKNNTNINDN